MGYENLIGKQFGYWTVLEDPHEVTSDRDRYWVCQCQCGTIKKVRGGSLKKGKSKSCGCLKKENSGQKVNLVGQTFDKLTVLEENKALKGTGRTYWVCQCECGNICNKTTTYLHRNDFFHSCGCYKKDQVTNLNKKNLIGQKFGNLTVIEETKERKNGCIVWKCRCDCGNIVNIITNSLTSGNTSSCGCINYSIGEKNISVVLTENNIAYTSQYTNKELNKKRFDFAILKDDNDQEIVRLIEFDGKQHFTDLGGIWNSKETLEDIQMRDKEKNEWAKKHNIPLIRIPYWERDNITLEMLMGDRYLVK